MSALAFEIIVTGDEDIMRYLSDVAGRAEYQMDRPLEQIADDVERLFAQAFGGSPDLIRSRELFNSLTSGYTDGAVREVSHDRMVRGTKVWWARFHRERLMRPLATIGIAVRWMRFLDSFIEHGSIGAGAGL